MPADPAVSIKNLRIVLPPGGERAYAVDGVSFDLAAGEIVCVVGESGSGKSMCAHAPMGLLPGSVTTETGEIIFEGHNLLYLGDARWRGLPGRRRAPGCQSPGARRHHPGENPKIDPRPAAPPQYGCDVHHP